MLPDYHKKVLGYFFEKGKEFTNANEVPVEIAGIGYKQEFRNTVYQLCNSKLLEKEVYSEKVSNEAYRITEEGRKVIVKGKSDEEIKHLILGLFKAYPEQLLRLDDIVQALPIERDRIGYLLDEMEKDRNVILKRIEESDNCFVIIESKGVKAYLKSEYLKPVNKILDAPQPTADTINYMSMVKYNKPRVFIGSSVEGKNIADAINQNLEHEAWCTVWPHAFDASSVTIDSLIENCSNYDFAIFIFSPDDIAEMRKTTLSVARDNVIFETGLFMGELGKDRVFIVQPRDIANFHVLTDLLGFTTVKYESERARRKEEVRSAVTTAASEIKKGIENSTWSKLQPKIKAASKDRGGNTYIFPLTVEFEIKNKHVYPVTIQSIDFELGNGLRFAPNSSEEQHKPLFSHGLIRDKEQITIENGERVTSCSFPIDPTIGEEVLRNAIEGGQCGRWTFRCIWIMEHVIVCKYEVKF